MQKMQQQQQQQQGGQHFAHSTKLRPIFEQVSARKLRLNEDASESTIFVIRVVFWDSA